METATNIRGIYHDQVIAPDGTVLHDSGWQSNTIVERCRILLAGFMLNSPTSGIRFLQVGQGNVAWDTGSALAPTANETALVSPAADPPVQFAAFQVAFLSAGGTTLPVTDPPTTRLQLTVNLPPGYPTPLPGLTTYPLREFGLFGDFNGTPYMINNIRHPLILKEVSTTLIRVLRLYF